MTIEGNIGVKVKKTLDESNVAETEYKERGVCDKREEEYKNRVKQKTHKNTEHIKKINL